MSPARPTFAFLFVLGVTLRAAPGDPGPLPAYAPPENVSRTIHLWGSEHVSGIINAWVAGFRSIRPDLTFDLKLLGNGTGMPALYTGIADLALFSRDTIVTDNDGFAHVRNYRPLRITLAMGSASAGEVPAAALLVHHDNPLARLTLNQVDAIFDCLRRRGSPQAIQTWGDLGLTGEWATHDISLYTPDLQSIAGIFFQHVALQDSRMMNWEHLTEFPDTTDPKNPTVDAAAQTAQAIENDRYGLAVSNVRYASPEVKVLAIAASEGGPYLLPSTENVTSGAYPFGHEIFTCVDQRPGRPLDGKVRDFVRYILSPAGQQVIAAEGSCLPLSAAQREQQLAKIP